MDKLIVKNFGPLKDIDIELNKINLFIGENGSGKSVLAKIVTILLSFNEFNEDAILKKFDEYNIDFITDSSIISLFYKNKLIIEIKKNNIYLDSEIKGVKNIIEKDNMKEILNEEIDEINEIDEIIEILKQAKQRLDQAYKEAEIIEKEKQTSINKLTSKYIPAERNLISLFSKSLSSLLVADIPLPKFLLRFSSDFEKAGNELKELEFLNVKYVNGDGLDRHKVYFNDENYLSLEHSSSGIQSALPLYLTIKYFANRHLSIIIEEPEQNLFPKAQAETIKYIIDQVSEDNILFVMTHSPYVLSTLNNLIMAYKVAQMSKETKEQVKELIKEEQWINPNEFSAYYLENGIAKNIVSKRGLISNNEIDDISDEMGDEFDTLMEIYREFKYAK